MGADRPKQFLEIDGKAVLQLTIEKFLSVFPDIRVIVVLPAAYQDWWKNYCTERNFFVRQTIVAGGITRFHSVRNGLEKVPDGDVVAVHDAVRPLLSEALIRELFAAAETSPCVAPAVPVVDTVRSISGKDVDRSDLIAIQTPQIFHSEVLRRAYSRPFDTSFTDDTSVAEAAGFKVEYKKGERLNIKITTPEDLVLARAIESTVRQDLSARSK